MRGADSPGCHDGLGHVQGKATLGEQGGGASGHGFDGMIMAVSDLTRKTAEQGAGPDKSAVEFDGGDLGGGGVPMGLDDLDLLEQPVHAHSGGPAGAVTAFPCAARGKRRS